MRLTLMISTLVMTTACNPPASPEDPLETLLYSQPGRFGTVLNDPEKFRVQIIYTRINRDAENRPTFESFRYHVDPTRYFYPASTVKLPAVALALEKLNLLDRPGLDRDTTMLTGSAADYQTEASVDETSPTGLPSVANYARKILLVSDNDAFNRLYEFLGQEEFNESLHGKGYLDTRIVHRLEVALSKQQNRWTNPVRFVDAEGETVFEQDAAQCEADYYGTHPELLGVAEIVDGERLEQPKDFSEKNAFGLQDQHDFVKNLMFPESAEPQRRLNLSDDDYRFIYRHMSMYPGESGIGAYSDADRYPEGYVKFLMYGGDAREVPARIRIFNKVGDAYGFLTDSAYIVDFDHNVEFLLSATIFTNENLTFNDNAYEYDEIGLPFLENLGLAVYEFELKRERENLPDLSRFKFSERD